MLHVAPRPRTPLPSAMTWRAGRGAGGSGGGLGAFRVSYPYYDAPPPLSQSRKLRNEGSQRWSGVGVSGLRGRV